MNNNSARFFYTDAEVDAVTSRYALRVAARLSEADVPHDISERLRVAREQAVLRAAAARRQVTTASATTAAPITVHVNGGAAALGGGPGMGQQSRWLGWMSILPVLAMLAGLWLIDHHWARSQIEAAADVDSALLADDLPPVAYSDAGFVEYLKAPQP
ncbi:MAG: hypothetical protein RJA98_1994 [Pseudomonadota bacterium]|jgi:hypothetical protein